VSVSVSVSVWVKVSVSVSVSVWVKVSVSVWVKEMALVLQPQLRLNQGGLNHCNYSAHQLFAF
jgi:hypothetical protein